MLVLFLLLPFHALFVTVGTRLLVGAGHPPLPELAIWKELLLVLIFGLGIFELLPRVKKRLAVNGERLAFRLDIEVGLILGMLVISFLLAALSSQLSALSFMFGFKYLFLPLILFLLFRALPWEEKFFEQSLFPAILVVAGIVALYGILSFFLPLHFFTALGYSDAHSLYSPQTPLSAFQLISDSGIRRIQSTFAGPNQLGMWLLLPYAVGLVSVMRGQRAVSGERLAVSNERYRAKKLSALSSQLSASHLFAIYYLLLIVATLFLTFSRAAWLAAFIITLVASVKILRGPIRETVVITLLTFACLAFGLTAFLAPKLLHRGISNMQHVERTRDAFFALFRASWGHGLGSAGPASNRVRDACAYFPDGADTRWARDRKDLCIFVGGAQVQPFIAEHVCQCASLPENWYLQVGLELGVAGLILFVLLVLSLLWKLSALSSQLSVFLVFLGVSIAALFLHAWEDSAVAYTIWGIAGIALASAAKPQGLLRFFLTRFQRQ